MEFITQNLSTIGLGILAIIVIVLITTGYVKAAPDTAIIISGIRKKPKVLIGRAGVMLPFLERKDELSLRQVTIDVKTGEYIPTLDFINIQVDAVVKVKVSLEPEKMELAMKNFLNKKTDEIVLDLQDSLQGNMREIIGTLSLKDICNNRDEFGNQVQSKAMVDMEKLGMEIISCNIQNIADKNGLIEDMGMDNTSKIKKDAAIAKAQADRDIAIAKANADKEANDARVAADTEIARQNNELAIKQAELKILSDTKEAEGIDKKAEAMRKMGEASVLEMFFKAYPEIMAAAAKPLEKVDSITMFGDGNSAKMVGDIVNSTKQVVSGIETSTGINLQALLAGFLGGELAKDKQAEKDLQDETEPCLEEDIDK